MSEVKDFEIHLTNKMSVDSLLGVKRSPALRELVLTFPSGRDHGTIFQTQATDEHLTGIRLLTSDKKVVSSASLPCSENVSRSRKVVSNVARTQ